MEIASRIAKEIGDEDAIEQIAKKLEGLGIDGTLSRLGKEKQEIAINIIASLWSINNKGLKIESDDAEIIGETAVAGLKDLKDGYHEPHDWFDGVLRTLTDLTSEEAEHLRKGMAGQVSGLTALYIAKLDQVSSMYESGSEVQRDYLKDRNREVDDMRLLSSDRVEKQVNKLI